MIDAARQARMLEVLRGAHGATVRITAVRPCAGGDINAAARLETSAGKFFVKWNAGDAPADMFEREAEGLRELARAGDAFTIPRVIHVAPADGACGSFLLLEWLDTGRPGPGYDEQLGRGLAALHAVSAENFGFAHDNYCGLTRQPNAWTASWGEFYARHRIGWQAELARDWESRADLYKLYHLLNHYNLFGGHYLQAADSIVRRFV
jgi:fructosamine-3-kinase